jgi:hypothetical protein
MLTARGSHVIAMASSGGMLRSAVWTAVAVMPSPKP